MPAILSGIFLALAVIIPLLLNGQPFTNSLIGLAFAFLAIACGRKSARDPNCHGGERRLGKIAAALAVILAAVLISQLPSSYRVQSVFNRHHRPRVPR